MKPERDGEETERRTAGRVSMEAETEAPPTLAAVPPQLFIIGRTLSGRRTAAFIPSLTLVQGSHLITALIPGPFFITVGFTLQTNGFLHTALVPRHVCNLQPSSGRPGSLCKDKKTTKRLLNNRRD